MSIRDDRYNKSAAGKAARRAWRRANRAKLNENKRQHRRRMRVLKQIGEALRARFPDFTATGEGADAQLSGSPAAAGVHRSLRRAVRSDAAGPALPPAAAPPGRVPEDGV